MIHEKKYNYPNEILQKEWNAEMKQIIVPSNSINKIVQERIASHIQTCSLALDNFHNSSLFFLLDSSNMQYLFVSRSSHAVLGYDRDEIIENGFQWLFTLLSPEELIYKKNVVEDMFSFLKTQGRDKMMKAVVKYDIVCHRKDGRKVHLLEELMFPEVSEDGDPLLISCFLHDIGNYSNNENRQMNVYLDGSQGLEPIYSKTYHVSEKAKTPLSKRELQVLEHFSNGLTATEVAKKIFVSYNTIKTHRKNILLKLDVQNTAEAIKFAIINKWIA